MLNSNGKQANIYLAADDFMQIHMSVKKIRDLNQDELSFAVRTFCYLEQEDGFAQNTMLKLILGIHKQGQGMTLAVDLLNLANIFPLQLKTIIEHIQQSPAFFEQIVRQLTMLEKQGRLEEAEQATFVKDFFISNAPKGITSFTTNRQATDMLWLKHGKQIISNLSAFKVDHSGGHISFTVQVGFKAGQMLQCYEVECMMHMFNEDEKLGYYFELYLDQENYHHQLIYEKLPDQFMNNKAFLTQILAQMKKRNEEHYDAYLQDLIEKFTASI